MAILSASEMVRITTNQSVQSRVGSSFNWTCLCNRCFYAQDDRLDIKCEWGTHTTPRSFFSALLVPFWVLSIVTDAHWFLQLVHANHDDTSVEDPTAVPFHPRYTYPVRRLAFPPRTRVFWYAWWLFLFHNTWLCNCSFRYLETRRRSMGTKTSWWT